MLDKTDRYAHVLELEHTLKSSFEPIRRELEKRRAELVHSMIASHIDNDGLRELRGRLQEIDFMLAMPDRITSERRITETPLNAQRGFVGAPAIKR